MRKSIKKITALLLSAALTAGSSTGVWASEAEVFTDGAVFCAEDDGADELTAAAEELFADAPTVESEAVEAAAEGIPGILDYALPDGKEGEKYSHQLKTDSKKTVVWSLGEGSFLPKGLTFSKKGLLSGVPQESGEFRLFVTIQAGELKGEKVFWLDIAEGEKVPAAYEMTPMEGDVLDLGVLCEGEKYGDDLRFRNSGTKAFHLLEPQKCQYFNLLWTDTDMGERVDPGREFRVNAKIKEGLLAGRYEEKVLISTKEGAEYEITVKAVVGPESEKDYALKFSPEKVDFPAGYFTQINKEEKKFVVENVGQKATRISMDTSGLKHFELRKNSFPGGEKVFKPGEDYTFYVKPSVTSGRYEEKIIFTTDDGSKFAMVVKMNTSMGIPSIKKDPYEVHFENLMEGYKNVPSQTITIENTYSEKLTIGVSHSGWLDVGTLSKTTLKPGEKAKIEVKPALGLKENSYHSYLFFTLKDADGKVWRDEMDIGFRVTPYKRLAAPYYESKVCEQNYCILKFREAVPDADGYQAVAVADKADLKAGKFISTAESSSLSVKIKYLPKGKSYIAYRSYADTKNGREYGPWSSGFSEVTIKDVTPKAPAIKSASVRYCDLKLQVSSSQKVDGYDVVLARKKNGTEPSGYVVTKTNFPGTAREITLYDIPKGTYYAAVHAYTRNKDGKKVISRWSNLKKITIEKAKVETPPVLKKVTVSGRDVILTVTRSKGTHGSYWVLAKRYNKDTNDRKYCIPTKYAYIERSRYEDKIIFKNVKPGNYYVSGHGYLSAYKRYYTKWSPLQKITVK